MTRAIVLQHSAGERPGRLMSLLAERGCVVEVRQLHRGQRVPLRIARKDLLVVLGGPFGIGDLEEVPFLRKEIRLLRRCIDDDVPVLGLGLGAQLLAFAAGAPVHPMVRVDGERIYEVGWSKVHFHHDDERDPVLAGLPDEAELLHWHEDMFELPRGSRRLASSALCENQAFQLGTQQFGLQFRCELGRDAIEDLLYTEGGLVEHAHGPAGAARIRWNTQRHLERASTVGDQLLCNILDLMLALEARRASVAARAIGR